MTLRDVFQNLGDRSDTFRDALRVPNANVLLSLGLLVREDGKAAPELTAEDLLRD
jgi:hypothetical protein